MLVYLRFFCILIVTGCTIKAANEHSVELTSDTIDIEHFNIVIAPDLSNRLDYKLYPKPLKDEDIVSTILAKVPVILNHRREENQQDRISVALINTNRIQAAVLDAERLIIDFGRFQTQKDRIDYLKGRSEQTFAKDTARFITEYFKIGNSGKGKRSGSDIWSFFNSSIDDTMIRTETKVETFLGKKYRNSFRNVLIILTDGYIEADLYGRNACLTTDSRQCYYLSSSRVREFRNAHKYSAAPSIQDFFKTSGWGISKANNDLLRNTEVLVLEVYDRSLTMKGIATVHPTDIEIIKLFWADWLAKSGVKRFDIRPVADTKTEIAEIVLKFLEVK